MRRSEPKNNRVNLEELTQERKKRQDDEKRDKREIVREKARLVFEAILPGVIDALPEINKAYVDGRSSLQIRVVVPKEIYWKLVSFYNTAYDEKDHYFSVSDHVEQCIRLETGYQTSVLETASTSFREYLSKKRGIVIYFSFPD